MQNIFKKSLIALFCLNFALSPLFFNVKKADAQLGDIAVTAIGCSGLMDKVTSAISNLVGGLTGVASAVPVLDNPANKKEGCLDAIAYTAAKIVLAKLTKSTLNWINSGFAGSPTFVQDPGSFFESIANEQVNSFTAKIAFNPEQYPFGRFTAQNVIKGIQGQLDNNAKISSGFVLKDEADPNKPYEARFEAFTNDFLYAGGWDGYLAVTEITQANPFDSYISAVNHTGPVVSAAISQKNPVTAIVGELQQASGFLSLKKCGKPIWYEDPSRDTSFTLAQAEAQAKNDPADADTQEAKDWLYYHKCEKWETQTPGTAIAEQMNISLGDTKRQLELADELNESISAIFDALMSQLFSKGVKALSGADDTGSNVSSLGGFGSNTGSSTIGSTSTTGSTAEFDQWYNQNQTFDLKEAIAPGGVLDDPDCQIHFSSSTGIISNPDAVNDPACNQGLAVLQHSYKQVLQAQDIKIRETIRWINYADYCIPGPRSDWYQGASEVINGLQEIFETDLPSISDTPDDASDVDLAAFSLLIQTKMGNFTGFSIDTSGFTSNLNKESTAVYNAIKHILSEKIGGWGYKQYIDYKYGVNSPSMPTITGLIKQEYSKKSRYQDVLAENLLAEQESETMFLRLKNIYNKILQAETNYGVGTPNFDKFMATQLKVFAQLYPQVKTVESVTKAITDYELVLDEISLLGDYNGGLVKDCVNETATLSPYPTSPYYTRMLYKESMANASDFTARGWPTTNPLSGYTNAPTFLPEVLISAGSGSTGGGLTGYIYIGHYVNGSSNATLDYFERSINIY